MAGQKSGEQTKVFLLIFKYSDTKTNLDKKIKVVERVLTVGGSEISASEHTHLIFKSKNEQNSLVVSIYNLFGREDIFVLIERGKPGDSAYARPAWLKEKLTIPDKADFATLPLLLHKRLEELSDHHV